MDPFSSSSGPSPATIETTIQTLQPQAAAPPNLSPRSIDSAHSRLRRIPSKRNAAISAPKRPAAGKGPSKLKIAPSAMLKPLVPKTERKPQDTTDLTERIRKNDFGRLDVSKAGSRGLTVSNVGNNGRIYLKPTTRPTNQRYASQPASLASQHGANQELDKNGHSKHPAPPPIPISIPETRRRSQTMVNPEIEQTSDLHLSQWETPEPTPVFDENQIQPKLRHMRNLSKQAENVLQGRRRAMSDSSYHDFPLSPVVASAVAGSDASGGLKIIISQSHNRPRTAEDGPLPGMIDFPIPSHRIGLPRFTARGTPVIRTSCYTATEDLQSSVPPTTSIPPPSLPRASFLNRSPVSTYIHGAASREPTWMMAQTPHRFLPSTPLLPIMPSFPLTAQAEPSTPAGSTTSHHHNMLATPGRNASPLRSTYMSVHQVIEPSMFDALTFKPACDDRALVRYSPISGSVTAATPPRLVAEITSANFLDYELLSDFFLTYRAFLEPLDLLRMLISRFRWAAARSDETGMVVRVRTFVALRHWILNYFIDDYIGDYELRVSFCTLVNDLIGDLERIGKDVIPHLKIVNELKKCWRRVCAQFWDGEDFETDSDDLPIAPGGLPSHKDSSLNPPSKHNSRLSRISMATLKRELSNVQGSVSAQSIPGDALVNPERPDTPPSLESFVSLQQQQQHMSNEAPRHGANPLSISSIDVVSCTFPTAKNFQKLGLVTSSHSNPVRPATAQQAGQQTSGGIASAPKGIVGKRVRPSHKRNGSLSDSLRDQPEPVAASRPTETAENVPFAGSLVRGDLFPPSQAFVEDNLPTADAEAQRQTTMLEEEQHQQQQQHHHHHQQNHADNGRLETAGTGPAVKKIFGSVRRALSTRCNPHSHNNNSNAPNNLLNAFGGTTRMPCSRTPATAVVPNVRAKKIEDRPTVRVDLLGVEISEAFKRAVQDEMAGDAAGKSLPPPTHGGHGELPLFSPAHLDGSFEDLTRQGQGRSPGHRHTDSRRYTHTRGMSDGAITTGSKSIMIINDTAMPMPFDLTTLQMQMPGVNASVEAFAEAFMPKNSDLTPPTTPPDPSHDRPRRSSHLLNHSFFARPETDSSAPLPPFVPDLQGLLDGGCLSPNEAFRSPQTATFPRAIELALGLTHESPQLELGAEFGQSFGGEFGRHFGGEFGAEFDQPPSRPVSDGAISVDAPTIVQGRPHSRMSSVAGRRNSLHATDAQSIRSSLAPSIRHMVPSIRNSLAPSYASSLSRISGTVQPLRILRRRPAGNLREAQTVEELGPKLSMYRSRSMTTIDTFTDTVRSSSIYSSHEESLRPSVYNNNNNNNNMAMLSPNSEPAPSIRSAGISDAASVHKKLSLFSTHSSLHPRLRPSLEIELRKLAEIPDDVDNGVETALMKLEGRYERPESPAGPLPPNAPRLRKMPVTLSQLAIGNRSNAAHEKRANRLVGIGHGQLMSPPTNKSKTSLDSISLSASPLRESFLAAASTTKYRQSGGAASATSHDSYASVPMLDRSPSEHPDHDHDHSVLTPSHDLTDHSLHTLDDDESISTHKLTGNAHHDSFAMMPGKSANGASLTPRIRISGSFLDDDSECGDANSIISSEISASPEMLELIKTSNAAGSLHTQPSAGTLTAAVPPSPPVTLKNNASGLLRRSQSVNTPSPRTDPSKKTQQQQLLVHKPLPPTPEATPTTTYSHEPRSGPSSPLAAEAVAEAGDREAAHLPFILAFDSEILAQQFTLIEKDALIEIDWRELVEMGWKNSTAGSWRSWLDFLRNSDCHGVEVVVARFNIMVKWAVSEILLTQRLEERARCIIKFIHIAKHCRRYRNFATLAQIAMALTSPEITRLAATWARVPPADVKIVRDLELLMTPTRNFYNMRAEMETGSDSGCIPFVGIYTHDLIFNAQRPSEIASSPTTAPLVNFERYRCAAAVVKTLLRLLEASALYAFQPIEGITERCLWMCALSDEELRRRAAQLE